MYPLWEKVIEPTLTAAGAQRVLEIGALAGNTTVKLLDLLGPEAELHVIDPVPQFDPSEHEQRFPGRYHFYRDISHEVLPKLPPMDAALIDGDHNWYTVYNELKMLAATAREAGAPLPLLFMHDVGWPYGRRDLYYAPERIPEEFRQPYAQKGLFRLDGDLLGGGRGSKGDVKPGQYAGGGLSRGKSRRTQVLDRGGLNPTMNNALREGGPRNGVMTALEDFMKEYDRELRLFVLPIYHSLAIVAEEERIASQPELAKAFKRLRSPHFLLKMLELAERLRIKEMQWSHVVFFHWQDRLAEGARRYLELLRDDLDDQRESLDHLSSCLEVIRTEKVDGHLVECGIAGADESIYMRAFAFAHAMSNPVLVADGHSSNGAGGLGQDDGSPSLEEVRERLRRLQLLDKGVELVSGSLPTALAKIPIEKVALLRVDRDAPPNDVLETLYDKVALGGYVIVDGCDDVGRRRAVDEFRAQGGVDEPLEANEAGAAVSWRKVH